MYGIPLNQEGCPYFFHVYPTQEYSSYYLTKNPMLISITVAAVFLFTIIMFFLYDRLVERRQRLVLAKATQSTAIVASLFPKQVRERLMAMETERRKDEAMNSVNQSLKQFLNNNDPSADQGYQPIADYFSNCTVMFADIAGFTAWSSTREPTQVFYLLQTVYQNFDLIAKRRNVFKVETIGDSYLAVTGLPEPQANHAIIMAKFAWDCLIRIGEITEELATSLGPETSALGMRFGMHSGPVTAGVLKGDRARFQLFGDTVNTAARMESTGEKGWIQISEATAELLRSAGKTSWVAARDGTVNAKGKGLMSTYWLSLDRTVLRSKSTIDSCEEVPHYDARNESNMGNGMENQQKKRMARLVDWVSDILLEQIKKVVSERVHCEDASKDETVIIYSDPNTESTLNMPHLNAQLAQISLDSYSVQVPADVISSLREFVSRIANSYRNNPFYNFEHACHAVMSASKLLCRIEQPGTNLLEMDRTSASSDPVPTSNRFGEKLDPMSYFAVLFSALIHDVDHQGVTNLQFTIQSDVESRNEIKQNAFNVAWDALMAKQFETLRNYVFRSENELMKFRELLANLVHASDFVDPRDGFHQQVRRKWDIEDDGSLTNTIRTNLVMGHIIQAAYLSHTMQHWHVYQKWSRRLFDEIHQAWQRGRTKLNPQDWWYKNELTLFDKNIIPLAARLSESNVFGTNSDEYLRNAVQNRDLWEEQGEEILNAWLQAFCHFDKLD